MPGGYARNSIQNMIKAAAQKAGIKDLTRL